MLKRTPQAARFYLLLAAFLIALPSIGAVFHPSMAGRLLVAPAGPGGGPFDQAVVYIVAHDLFHAHGLILNKPQPDAPLIGGKVTHYGGPVDAGDRLQHSDVTGESRPYLGYSGWGPLQLDYELLRNGWHVIPADPGILNAPAAEMWQKSLESVRRSQGVAHGGA